MIVVFLCVCVCFGFFFRSFFLGRLGPGPYVRGIVFRREHLKLRPFVSSAGYQRTSGADAAVPGENVKGRAIM